MEPTLPTQDEFLTVGDAARVVGLSPSRIRQLVDGGELPAARTRGGIRLISRSAVERLAAERLRAKTR